MSFIVPGRMVTKTWKVALIDADCIKYRVISRLNIANEITKEEVHVATEKAVQEFRDLFTCKAMLFCFSGATEDNFRFNVAYSKMYKGTRDTGSSVDWSPVKRDIVSYIRNRYPSLLFKDLEADDLLAMLQDDETFIYSEDKDLLQVPGTHWNLKTRLFHEVLPKEGLSFLMSQMILGDTVDNIGGLKGYGPAKCATLLTEYTSGVNLPVTVLLEYVKVHGLTHGLDAFVENYNLLKLRENRGAYFREKYMHAFQTLNTLKE